ncbi:DEAD/DEAH box helicase [Clostridium sp. CTA-19]
MLSKDILLQRFNENTSGKNHISGERIFNNDLVSKLDIESDEHLVCIKGNVISEKLFSDYDTNIEIDTETKLVISTYCTCPDYEKKEFSNDNYCCKHLIATFYKSLDSLVANPLLFKNDVKSNVVFKKENSILDSLLEDSDKEELRLDVYINKREWDNLITAEFKIGLKANGNKGLYTLKDIEQFLTAYYNKIAIRYGKNFTLDIKNQKLSTKDKRLLDFIELLKVMDNSNSFNRKYNKNIDGKFIKIPNHLIREFFQRVKNHRVYLNEGFFYRAVETEIVNDFPSMEFGLKDIKKSNEYILSCISGVPTVLNDKCDVFLFGTIIYLPDYENCYKIERYLNVFNGAKSVAISKEEEDRILRKLIPDLNLISQKLTLSKSIKDKIIMEDVKFKFYFDMEGKDVVLNLKVQYGEFEFNIFQDISEKVIYREKKKELRVISKLKSLGFDEIKEKFYLLYGDDYKFKFFKEDIWQLEDFGEIYYSQNFKGIKSIGSKGIKGQIHSGKHNYFEIDFKVGDIPAEETISILRAFKENLKYYKLKSGEFLDLEELELKKFLNLLDIVSYEDNIENNIVKISNSKAMFLDNYLKENSIRYVKGKNELKEIKDKFKNIEKLSFKEPKELNATLRPYQRIGYNYLKTLEYLGFGGILADEMGLGKTLQVITYILSNKGKKSLVIVPTSLIYNWKEEFSKFAPSIKIVVINGDKKSREEIIKKKENFDVIITTYNLLKIDLEFYKKQSFHTVILDEAQYIKNPNSQNAKAVKDINGDIKFALSGTPIENSLMELWSIFDFIMPTYLYDENKFSVRYHKRLKEGPEVLEELNKLIAPFILRRKKKDVVKELPNKLEKKLLVSLNDKQKSVYKTYANHAVELIENKVKNDEFRSSKIEILAYITKLRQICLDPSLVSKDYTYGSGKIEALVELLQQSIEGGHKVLVFSQFTSALKNIQKRLETEDMSFSYLDGSVKAEKRMEMVGDFNNGDNSIFLISLKAGGTGLNLTSADIVIHFDPWWNPAVEDQATDRAHRIGQKNVVQVIKLIAEGTIEEKIVQLQDEKRKLISQIMDNENEKGNDLLSLSEEELLSLFELN